MGARHRSVTQSAPPRNSRNHRPGGRPHRRPGPQALRVLLVWSILLLAVLGLLGRLAQLQIFQGAALSAIAQQQRGQAAKMVMRLPIVDSDGALLAVDRLVYTLYAHPVLFRQPMGVVAQTLGAVINTPADTLVQQLKAQRTGIRLRDDLPEETANRLRQLHLEGLELLPSYQRFYPQQDLFSQIVGFVNLEGQAQTGLEARYQQRLRMIQPAAPQSSIASVVDSPERRQHPLQLTLNSQLQRVAQASLQEALAQSGARRGTAMVMDVNTGALRAFAVAPTFDPNQYFEADLAWLKNWAVTDVFEPGSTFKPINVAIALEAGAIAPTDTVYDAGRIIVDDWPIQNADYETSGRVGPLSLTEVLKYSSNVGMVRIMEQMPAADFYRWLQTLDLETPTGIDLPAESAVPLKARSHFVNSPADVATAAFGQGLVLTPIKLLQLQAAIANGGRLVTPHVINGFMDESGTPQWQPWRPAARQLFSETTTQAVLGMMEAVVESGTGKAAQIPGYRIAGKTGTAQKVTDSGQYGEGRVVSFAGLLPAEAPRFVVLAIIDDPIDPSATGGKTAAPLAKRIMESLVVLEGIPPSSPQALGGVVLP